MKAIGYAIDKLISGTGFLAALLIFGISLFVFVNSVSRFAGFSLPWLFDMTTFSMVIMAFIGAGYALREKAHVKVDLVRVHVSEPIGHLLDIFVYMVCLFFFVIIGWTGWEWALDSYQIGQVSATSVLKIPLWTITVAIPLGCVLLVLQTFVWIFKLCSGLNRTFFQSLSAGKLLGFVVTMAALIALCVAAFLYLNPLLAMLIFVLFVLFAGVPVAFSLGLAGCIGLLVFMGYPQMTQIPILTFQALNSWPLTAAPLFILGGMLMNEAKIAEKVFLFIETLFVRVPSPLLMATIISGAIFCAITGSSVAAHAAIAAICLPLLFARGYNKLVSVGVVAGSTVGTLIPPSNGFILYGVLTDESIGQLFMAGVGPSVVLFSMYILYVLARAILMGDREREPMQAISAKERITRLKSGVWGILAPVIILGGIYFGAFTPTEAGAVLVVYALFVGVFINREIRWPQFKKATMDSTRLSLMILFIIAGASIYGAVIAQNQFINALIAQVKAYHITAMGFLIISFIILSIMGMFMEAVSIMMLTVPITFPVAVALGVDPLWFGVFYIITMEIAQLTPPVGLNLFVLQGATGMSQALIIKGTYPFLIMMTLTLIIMYFFPGIATWIPGTMFGN
jgi:C4-dicarboxylate transporter DctM subunit